MAEEKFRLIFESEGLDEIEKQIEESLIAVEKLKQRKQELHKELKEGKITTEQYATGIFEVNNEIKDYQNKIKSLTTTQAALNVVNKKGVLSYNDLTKLYKVAEQELRKMKGTLKVNEDSTIELNEAYKEQLEKVKRLIEANIDFDRSLKDSKTNVGNYKEAVEELEEKFDKIEEEIKDASSAINDLKENFAAGGEIIDRIDSLTRALSKEGFGNLIKTIKSLGKALLTNPIFLIAAVLIAIYQGLQNTSKGFEALTSVTRGFGKIASAVFKIIKPLIDGVAEVLLFVADILVDVAELIDTKIGKEGIATLSDLQQSLDDVSRQAEILSQSFEKVSASIDTVFSSLSKRVGNQVNSIKDIIKDTEKLSENLIKDSEKTVVQLVQSRVKLVKDLQSVSGKTFNEFEKALKAGAVVSEQELATYQKILEIDGQIRQIDADKYRIAEEKLNLESEAYNLQAESIDLLIQIKQAAGEINLEEGKGLEIYRKLKEQQFELVYLAEERAAKTQEAVKNAQLRLQLAREQLNAELKAIKETVKANKEEEARLQREERLNNKILEYRLKIAESKSTEFFYALQLEKVEKQNREKAIEYLKIIEQEKQKQLDLEYRIAIAQAEAIENENERALAIKEANQAYFEAREALKKELSEKAIEITVNLDFQTNEFDVENVQGNLFTGLREFYSSEEERLRQFKETQKAELQELLDSGLITYQQFTEALQSIDEAYIENVKKLQENFKANYEFWQNELVAVSQTTIGLLSEFGSSAFELIKSSNQEMIDAYIQTGKELPSATKNTLKAFFAIQKAAAIANIVVSQSQALANELKNASTLPPPANIAYYAAAAARVVATMTSLLSTIKGMTFENALGAGGTSTGSAPIVNAKSILGRQIIETSGSVTASTEANVIKNPDQLNNNKPFVVDVKDLRQGLSTKGRIEDNRKL